MLQSDRAEVTGSAAVIEMQCPFCSVQCKMTVTEGGNGIPGQRRAVYKVEGVPNAASEGRGLATAERVAG